jgi:hypothetical protein
VSDHDAAVVDRYLRAVQAGDAAPKGRFHELELQFVTSVRSFSMRNGISYGAWRDVGVDLEVLARAGISDPDATRPCSRVPRGAAHGLRAAARPHPVAGCGDDR